MSIISYYRNFVCSKFYSLVLSCTAHAAPQPHKRAKRRFCGWCRVRVRRGVSAPHGADLGEMWEWIRFDSLFRFWSKIVNQFWFTLAVRVRISHSSSVLRLSYTHILSWFFLLPCVTLLNTLSGEKKEPREPYRFGKVLRALSIFSLFYPGVRVHFPRKSWCKLNKNQIIRILASIKRLCK